MGSACPRTSRIPKHPQHNDIRCRVACFLRDSTQIAVVIRLPEAKGKVSYQYSLGGLNRELHRVWQSGSVSSRGKASTWFPLRDRASRSVAGGVGGG